jgi:hypothetical protein
MAKFLLFLEHSEKSNAGSILGGGAGEPCYWEKEVVQNMIMKRKNVFEPKFFLVF